MILKKGVVNFFLHVHNFDRILTNFQEFAKIIKDMTEGNEQYIKYIEDFCKKNLKNCFDSILRQRLFRFLSKVVLVSLVL